jgi:hypothetical protein
MTCQGCPHAPPPVSGSDEAALTRFRSSLRAGHSFLFCNKISTQLAASEQLRANCVTALGTRLRPFHYTEGLSVLFLSHVNKCHDVLTVCWVCVCVCVCVCVK